MAFISEPWKYLTRVCCRFSRPSNSRSGSALEHHSSDSLSQSNFSTMTIFQKLDVNVISQEEMSLLQVRHSIKCHRLIEDRFSPRSKCQMSDVMKMSHWVTCQVTCAGRPPPRPHPPCPRAGSPSRSGRLTRTWCGHTPLCACSNINIYIHSLKCKLHQYTYFVWPKFNFEIKVSVMAIFESHVHT